MSSVAKWWSRVAAAVTGAVLTMVIPAYAWAAENGVADVAGELARKRGGGLFRGVGLLGLLCCLVVVGGIVLAILLVMRSRRKPPPPR